MSVLFEPLLSTSCPEKPTAYMHFLHFTMLTMVTRTMTEHPTTAAMTALHFLQQSIKQPGGSGKSTSRGIPVFLNCI
jgi:hypothetical protein